MHACFIWWRAKTVDGQEEEEEGMAHKKEGIEKKQLPNDDEHCLYVVVSA